MPHDSASSDFSQGLHSLEVIATKRGDAPLRNPSALDGVAGWMRFIMTLVRLRVRRAHPDHRLEEVLICARGLIGHGNVVSLHIEDEKPRLVLGHRCGFGQFGSLYPEETAEYTIHGSEGESHATGSSQELTAVYAQGTSLPLRARNDFLLQLALLRSLGDGQVLLVRDSLSGHRQMAIEPCIEIRFTDPSIVDLGFRAGRNGLWV